MTKVSFFTLNLGLGGAERVLVNLTSELVERNRDVEIVLAEKRGKLLEQVHEDVSVVDLNTKPFIPLIPAIRSYIKNHQPDVLVSTVNTANLATIIALNTTRTDTRHVIRMANTPSQKIQTYNNNLSDTPIPYLMKLLYPLGREFITISKGLADDLVKMYDVDRSKITTIYNPCVNDNMLKQGEGPIHCDWFSDDNIKVILGVGSLTQQKDFQTLLFAFLNINNLNNEYKLVILGEGPKRENLEQICRDNNIEDDVWMPGEVSNPYPYMKNADLFVLSSRWEGFGIVNVEAMSFGTQVVATDCPHGPSEILEQGKYGRLVPVGDPEKLSAAIQTSISDPISERLLINRSNQFHIEKITTEYENVLF